MRIGGRLGPFYASTGVSRRTEQKLSLGCVFTILGLIAVAFITLLTVGVVRWLRAITLTQGLVGGGVALALVVAFTVLVRTPWTHPIPPPQAGDECAAALYDATYTHPSMTHVCSLPVPHPAHTCACGHAWPVQGVSPPVTPAL